MRSTRTTPSIVFQTSYPQRRTAQHRALASMAARPAAIRQHADQRARGDLGNFQCLTPMASAGSLLFVSSERAVSGQYHRQQLDRDQRQPRHSISVITPQMHGSLTPTYVGTASGGRSTPSPDAGIPAPVFNNVTGNYPGGRVSDVAMDPVDPSASSSPAPASAHRGCTARPAAARTGLRSAPACRTCRPTRSPSIR